MLHKKSFRLPRVEKEKFILLIRLGLEYNKVTGNFSISNYNNVEKLADTIAEILNVDEVTFTQNCIRRGKDFPCTGCKYADSCPTRDLPFQCVCAECLRDERSFEKSPENTP
jgi:hypothetical protein